MPHCRTSASATAWALPPVTFLRRSGYTPIPTGLKNMAVAYPSTDMVRSWCTDRTPGGTTAWRTALCAASRSRRPQLRPQQLRAQQLRAQQLRRQPSRRRPGRGDRHGAPSRLLRSGLAAASVRHVAEDGLVELVSAYREPQHDVDLPETGGRAGGGELGVAGRLAVHRLRRGRPGHDRAGRADQVVVEHVVRAGVGGVESDAEAGLPGRDVDLVGV